MNHRKTKWSFIVAVVLAMIGITTLNISPQCRIQFLSVRCEDTSGAYSGCEDWPEGSRFANTGSWCINGIFPGSIAFTVLALVAGVFLISSTIKKRKRLPIRQIVGVVSLVILFSSIWIPTHDLGHSAIFGQSFLWGESSNRVFVEGSSFAWLVDPLEAIQQLTLLLTTFFFLCLAVREHYQSIASFGFVGLIAADSIRAFNVDGFEMVPHRYFWFLAVWAIVLVLLLVRDVFSQLGQRSRFREVTCSSQRSPTPGSRIEELQPDRKD